MANLRGGSPPVKTPFRPPLIKSSSFATTIGEFGKNSSVLNDLLMKTPITRNIYNASTRLVNLNQQLDSKIQSIEDYLQIPIERNNNMDGGRRTTRSNKKSIKSGGDLAEGIMGSAEDVASMPLPPPESPVEPFTAPFTPPPEPDPPTPAPISSYGPPADYIVQSYKVMGKDGKEIIQGTPVECMAVINGDMVIHNKGTASIISSKDGSRVSVVGPNGIKSRLFTPSACVSSQPTLITPQPDWASYGESEPLNLIGKDGKQIINGSPITCRTAYTSKTGTATINNNKVDVLGPLGITTKGFSPTSCSTPVNMVDKAGKPIINGSPVKCIGINGLIKTGTAAINNNKVDVLGIDGSRKVGFSPSSCLIQTNPTSSVSDLVTIMKSISQNSAATSEVNTMILGPMTYFKELQMKLSAAEENSARFLNRLNFIAEKIKRLANVENKIKEICVTSTLDTYGEPQVKLPPVVKNPFTKLTAKPVLSRPLDWWGGKRTRSKRHSKRSSMKKRK